MFGFSGVTLASMAIAGPRVHATRERMVFMRTTEGHDLPMMDDHAHGERPKKDLLRTFKLVASPPVHSTVVLFGRLRQRRFGH